MVALLEGTLLDILPMHLFSRSVMAPDNPDKEVRRTDSLDNRTHRKASADGILLDKLNPEDILSGKGDSC